jgi:HAD superfamily hydrolase (TIGR01458 family)
MTPLSGVRALLLDLDGTVYQSGSLIPGAADALAALAARRIPHCFVTNTSSRPRSTLVRELAEMGLPVDAEQVFTAPRAARDYLLRRGLVRCHLMVAPEVFEDFEGIEPAEERAEAVVLGYLGEAMTYSRLNRAFRLLLDGAELVTFSRNRYFAAPDGLSLDDGAFAAALEHASGRTATIVGKPAPEFFSAALRFLKTPPTETAVVGDDLEGDVAGAQGAGMRGVLVQTGKFRPEDLERSPVRPDAVLASLADLPAAIRGD